MSAFLHAISRLAVIFLLPALFFLGAVYFGAGDENAKAEQIGAGLLWINFSAAALGLADGRRERRQFSRGGAQAAAAFLIFMGLCSLFAAAAVVVLRRWGLGHELVLGLLAATFSTFGGARVFIDRYDL